MATVRPIGEFPDASEMLAEALKQMDGLLADTTTTTKTAGNGGCQRDGPQNGAAGQQRPRYGSWTASSSRPPSKEQASSSSSTDPHKLDLMAENSSLKVKLAKMEKSLKDSEDKLGFLQHQVGDLQTRLNDRTIEVTELRSRLTYGTSSNGNSVMELEKLKHDVETLLVTSHEKDRRIDGLCALISKYRKLEAMVAAQSQGAKLLEQLGLDSESVVETSSLSRNASSSHDPDRGDRQLTGGAVHDALKPSMPHPSATSTPVHLNTAGSTGSTRRPDAGNKSPSVFASPLSTIAYSPDRYNYNNDDDVDIKTLPTTARGHTAEPFVKADADEETLKDEMALEYKALQNHQQQPQQPTGSDLALKKKSSSRGLKKFFGKLKRSNSQDLDDKTEEFKRNGLRSTAGPRLGWSKDLNDLDLPFSRWDAERIALWLHVIGLSAYVGNCKRWGRNGEQLLQATTHDLKKKKVPTATLR